MSILNTINLIQTDGISNTGFTYLKETSFNQTLELQKSLSISNTLELNPFLNQVSNNLSINQNGQQTNDYNLIQRLVDQTYPLGINLFLGETTSVVTLNQVVGQIIPILNPNAVTVNLLLQNDNYIDIPFLYNVIQEDSRQIINQYVLSTYSGGLNGLIEIELTDGLGPVVLNISPAPDSSFNNPLTNISFDITDLEGSDVVLPSININVNGLLLISGGVNVTPPASGVSTLSQTTSSSFHFLFNPSFEFLPENNPVTVSITAQDGEIVPNLTNYSYNFNVWYSSDLYANIVGLPDGESPYLSNLNPANAQVDVGVDTNISLDIIDDATGVNPSSVNITVLDIQVVSGGIQINTDFANTNITSIEEGRGRRYEIDPVEDLPFFEQINVDVYAEDLYTPAINILDTSYSFITFDNSYLLASGLQVYENTSWNTFNLNESHQTVSSGTDFRIKYYNLNSTGVSITGSSVLLNNVTISSTIVELSAGYEYEVYFNIIPDYRTDADLTFHVVADLPVSGVQVYRDFETELLWGAEFCYNPDQNLTFNTDIPVFVQACDFGYLPSKTSLFHTFKTIPMPGNSLYAEIIPVNPPHDMVGGEIISNNPFFEYGKTMNMRIEVQDFAGNLLNYNWSFVITSG